MVPSLAVNPDEKVNLQDYDARKLCDAVSKQNPHAMRMIKKGLMIDVGDESMATDESTATGGPSVKNTSDAERDDLSDKQVGEIIMANAAKIQDSIENTGKHGK